MAKNKNGIMGMMSGKIGTVVGCVDKYGRNYFRARDVVVVNPRTPKQQGNRNKFGALSAISKVLAPTLNNTMLFHGNELKTTPRNAFIKANMKTFDGTAESLVLGYGQLAMPIVTIGEEGQDPGSHPLVTADLPEPDNACPHFRIALCLFCEGVMETKTVTVNAGSRFRTGIPDEWRQFGYYLYAVTYNANTAPFWLGAQFTSGSRLLHPYETSDTSKIAIPQV